MSGLYSNPVLVERWVSGDISAGTLDQSFVAPVDLVVVGLVAILGTAPGGDDAVTVNVTDFPTSQQGGVNSSVSAYNLWTATNVPTVTGTATSSFTTSNSDALVDNRPYDLNYPLPGPAGSTGYETSQSTSPITTDPVTAPPYIYKYDLGTLVAPDNTYVDYNAVTQSAALVHAGDVLSFVVAGTAGDAAGLEVVLFCQQS